MNGRRAIVTGSSGFLAPRLMARLSDDGWRVYGIDRVDGFWTDKVHDLSTGFPQVGLKPGDVIFHLAAAAEIRLSATDDWMDMRDNVQATIHVMRAAVNAGVRVVFASTMGVFDSHDVCHEGTKPEPASLYGASKVAAEAYVQAFARSHELQAAIFRLCNTCGRGMRHGLALDFVRKVRAALVDRPVLSPPRVQMLGNGYNVRPFLHVDDAIEGIVLADEMAAWPPPTIHFAPDDSITIREAVLAMSKAIGFEGEILWQEQQSGWRGDVKEGFLGAQLARNLGWHTPMTSSEAIARAAYELWTEGE